MKVYRIEVKVAATAYIKADSEAEALSKVQAFKDVALDVDSGQMISDLRLDDPRLPEISLSPMMAIYGPWDETPTAELATDD